MRVFTEEERDHLRSLTEGLVGTSIEVMGNPYKVLKQRRIEKAVGEVPREAQGSHMQIDMENEDGQLMRAFVLSGMKLLSQTRPGSKRWMVVKYRL